jgi:chromate transporter
LRPEQAEPAAGFGRAPSRVAGGALLLAVPVIGLLLWLVRGHPLGYLASAMFNAGSLVFGGGHVVLPFLNASVGPLVGPDTFLAGYGLAQAMPGPLFTFATYLGQAVSGPLGAAVATVAIFLPGLLLVLGALPFWVAIRHTPWAGGAVAGANAAVVGLLAGTLVNPLASEAVTDWRTGLLAVVLFVAVRWWKPPIWALVVAALAAGLLLG